jgi:DNA-directed RNA polymerase subunit alpha
MAILAFQKPDKVIMLESTDTFGVFEFRPLEPGYGITVGNALRRILLSSLEGYAISTIKIEGVEHEFSTIKGVVEDITDIILNLKQIRFKKQIDDVNDERIEVSITGQDKIKAGDLNRFLNGFKVLNPEQIICTLEPEIKFQMAITIHKGRGYVPAEENKPLDAEFGLIPIDSIFTPVKNVKFKIENYRVEQKNRLREVAF